MNYLILAAGRSTRFGRNKLEEEFGGKTLPELAAEFAIANGATKIFTTVSRADIIIKNNSPYHKTMDRISKVGGGLCEFQFQREGTYGPGAAITQWSGIIDGPFTVLFGDNFYRGRLHHFYLKEFADPANFSTYFSTRYDPNQNPRNLQLAAVIDNYIVEKPHAFLKGNYFCGLVRFPARCFNTFSNLQKSDRGEVEIADMVNMSVHPQAVSLLDLDLTWGDITYPSDIPFMTRLVGSAGK